MRQEWNWKLEECEKDNSKRKPKGQKAQCQYESLKHLICLLHLMHAMSVSKF